MKKMMFYTSFAVLLLMFAMGFYKMKYSHINLLPYSQKDENINDFFEDDIINPSGETLETRFNVPSGYIRLDTPKDSFLYFLRNYVLKEDGKKVLLYNGREKGNQEAHAAVFGLPIENYDLQQCADSVMRVWAEYYWQSGQKNKIAFHFTNGFLCEYSKWKEGYRVVINGNETRWEKRAYEDDSYENFTRYLKIVFSYAGTASMREYESQTVALSELTAGDVILKGGNPGHVVMVVDVCQNNEGRKAFLLAQGYMPAQEFHVINNPLHQNNPWYMEEEMEFPLETSEYTFDEKEMVRRLTY